MTKPIVKQVIINDISKIFAIHVWAISSMTSECSFARKYDPSPKIALPDKINIADIITNPKIPVQPKLTKY